jgi:hypothetical protein
MSALCQKQTFTLQQIASLFDHLVGAVAVQNRSAKPALTSWIQTPVLPALTIGPIGPPTGLEKPEPRDAAASAVAVVLMYGFIASPGRIIELT